LDTGTIW